MKNVKNVNLEELATQLAAKSQAENRYPQDLVAEWGKTHNFADYPFTANELIKAIDDVLVDFEAKDE